MTIKNTRKLLVNRVPGTDSTVPGEGESRAGDGRPIETPPDRAQNYAVVTRFQNIRQHGKPSTSTYGTQGLTCELKHLQRKNLQPTRKKQCKWT